MDGVSQMANPVAPGASFTYEFPVQDAGIYWYHPHMDTAIALERGLYGTIVVREPGEQRAVCDLPVVLDDVLLDGSGQIAPSSEMVGAMGRLGNLLLANGQSDRELDVAAGQTVLLRLVNAANARHFALKVPGLSLQVLATDGGWLDAPRVVDALQLGPGERSIIRVDLQGEPGQRLALMSGRVHLHGADAHMQETDPLGDEDQTVLSFVLGDEGRAVASDWQPPQPDVPALAAGDVLHRWVITESGMHEHRIDGEVFPNVPVVEASPLTATTFEIENRSGMRHPFHIHGQRFAVVDDGSGQATGGWKDTWDVPAGAVVRVVSELDNPGTWMYHCHILEHADGGMAGLLQVGEGEPMDGMGAH
jgi:FtsP/CotA-like multicopper oxidase with cupredoxin domain